MLGSSPSSSSSNYSKLQSQHTRDAAAEAAVASDTNGVHTGNAATVIQRPSTAVTSTRVATVIFFKGLFGAGVLAIPHAFSSCGLQLGVACFVLVSGCCLITMLILLECQRIIRVQEGRNVENYEELAGVVSMHDLAQDMERERE